MLVISHSLFSFPNLLMQRYEPIKELKRGLRRSIKAAILGTRAGRPATPRISAPSRLAGLPSYVAAATALYYVKAFPEEVNTHSLMAEP